MTVPLFIIKQETLIFTMKSVTGIKSYHRHYRETATDFPMGFIHGVINHTSKAIKNETTLPRRMQYNTM